MSEIQFTNSPVSSLEALASSIRCDHQVYRWFLRLIRLGDVRAWCRNQDSGKELYDRLSKISLLINGIYCLGLSVAFLSVALSDFRILWWNLLIAGIGFSLYKYKRGIVSELGKILICKDFEPADVSQNTLYEIGEFYGRKYQIASLVDMIYVTDNIVRNTFIVVTIAVCFIYPVEQFLNILIILACSYFVVFSVINSAVVYNKIK